MAIKLIDNEINRLEHELFTELIGNDPSYGLAMLPNTPSFIKSFGFHYGIIKPYLRPGLLEKPKYKKYSLVKLSNKKFLGMNKYKNLPAKDLYAFIIHQFFEDIDSENTLPSKVEAGRWRYEANIYDLRQEPMVTPDKEITLYVPEFLTKQFVPEHYLKPILKKSTSKLRSYSK